NSQVWTGTDRSADCMRMCENIINAGYSLGANYRYLFLADNNINSSAGEFIALVPQDGLHLQAYGCMTFIINAETLSDYSGNVAMGVGGWNGLTTRPELYNKFAQSDARAMFFTNGHSLNITELTSDTKVGYGITKFRNVTSTGAVGSDNTFVDTDYPLFRLADAYLMYAEAAVRTGQNKVNAVNYVNQLRNRAGIANISESDLTLDFILDERARELYWEGWRRQDLIRFGKFTSDAYKWQWKGNIQAGSAIPEFRNVYPIPVDQLQMNSNLTQNAGY
ncbi:MAG: RagB/SusD family nutrient uptake outer membrane protein, partial [Paludibacter sp.]|nr:RagB/SusD family nutrient uptake outer membrane protein [Paludibacter sp.]